MDLDHDLLSILPSDDNLVAWLETLTEQVHIQLHRFCSGTDIQTNPLPANLSRDPNVHIFTSSSIRGTVRALLAPLITFLLLTPVIVCNAIHNSAARLFVIALATTFLVAILSGLTRADTMQLVMVGAT